MNHEAMIRATDIQEARSRLKNTGQAAILELFSREPLLAQAMANRTEGMRRLLLNCGVKDSDLEKLLPALMQFVLEPLLTLDAAHLRLMDGLLPGEDLRPVRLLPPDPALRSTFAVTCLRPADVQALAPAMNRFQAQMLLTDHEGPIAMAMRQAALEMVKVLLARKDVDHGTNLT